MPYSTPLSGGRDACRVQLDFCGGGLPGGVVAILVGRLKNKKGAGRRLLKNQKDSTRTSTDLPLEKIYTNSRPEPANKKPPAQS